MGARWTRRIYHTRCPFQCMAEVVYPLVHTALLASVVCKSIPWVIALLINPSMATVVQMPSSRRGCLSVTLPHCLRQMQAEEPQRSAWWAQDRIVFPFCAVKPHA